MISHTADVLAARRALATSQGSRLINDPTAEHFTSKRSRQIALESDAPIHFVLLRHRHLEDFVLRQPFQVEQVVVLGAGFDTKYARHAALRKIEYLEVDAPEMLERKKEVLGRLGYPVPPSYPSYLESPQDLAKLTRLTSPDKKTVVIAEGVFMYHPRSFLDSVVAGLASYYQNDIALGFDLFAPELASDPGFQARRVRIESRGEVFKLFLPPRDANNLLSQHGLNATIWDFERLCRHHLDTPAPRLDFHYICCARSMKK